MLNNYVDANFVQQKNSEYIIDGNDGFFYVNLGLKSVLQEAELLMQLQEIHTEYRFQFVNWITITQNCSLSHLYRTVPPPLWKNMDPLPLNANFSYDANVIFNANKHRFRLALPGISEPVARKWFSEHLQTQIRDVQSSPRNYEISRYNSKSSYGYVLPLYFEGKLVLTVVLERKNSVEVEQGKSPEYLVVAVLLPAWAYNNTRILGPPKTAWMRNYAENYSEEEEQFQKAQQQNLKEKNERQKCGESKPQT